MGPLRIKCKERRREQIGKEAAIMYQNRYHYSEAIAGGIVFGAKHLQKRLRFSLKANNPTQVYAFSRLL